MPPRRTTLKDVAARAGVSVSTVSYALNDSATVALAPATRARIRKIAKDMGYVPNSWARSLQSRNAAAVGVLLDKPLSLPRYAAVIEGMRPLLRTSGLHLVLLDSRDDDVERAAVEDYRAGRIDALVVVGHDDVATSNVVDEAVADLGMPLVALDCGFGPGEQRCSTIEIDYAAGVVQVVDHLVAHGVEHLVHVRPSAGSRAERARHAELMHQVAQRPGLSVQVVLNGIDEAALAATDTMGVNALDALARLEEPLTQALAASPVSARRTAVLCSWGVDLERALAVARRVAPGCTVAGLTQGNLTPALWPGLVHSRISWERAGYLCAQALLGELAVQQRHTHHVVTPTLEVGS